MINDDDCDTPGIRRPSQQLGSPPPPGQWELMVQIARIVPQVQKAFKSAVIPSAMMVPLLEQIKACSMTLAPQHQPASAEYLDAGFLVPMIHLQNLELLLHRHNLSPSCPAEARTIALEGCVAVAQETARFFSRVIPNPYPPTPGTPAGHAPARWDDALRHAATAALCTHLWRCTLFLSATGDDEGALICASASRAVGGARPANRACGRYLEFWLGVLRDRRRRGGGGGPLDEDDTRLAYLSADLQSNPDQAWVWQAPAPPLWPADHPAADVEVSPRSIPPVLGHRSPAANPGAGGAVAEAEARAWDGWARVVDTLRGWRDDAVGLRPSPPQPPPSSGPRLRPSPPQQPSSSGPRLGPSPGSQHPAPPPTASAASPSNRMSIADII